MAEAAAFNSSDFTSLSQGTWFMSDEHNQQRVVHHNTTKKAAVTARTPSTAMHVRRCQHTQEIARMSSSGMSVETLR